MSLPRMASIWLSVRSSRLVPSNRIMRPTTRPGGWETRRDFLKSSAATVAGAYGLSPSLGLAEQVPDKFDGLSFKLTAPEPNAKSGGVLRMGMPMRAPHFDIHQSGTIFTLGAQACM